MKTAVQTNLKQSDIPYIGADKNRTNIWLEALRLQLPAGLTKYGSVGNVAYATKDVKGKSPLVKFVGKTTLQEAMERAQQKITS